MPSLTIKSLPDGVYRRLKERARLSRRSLNAEVIVALEEATGLRRAEREEILAAIRALRSRMPDVDHDATLGFRDEGRS